jgi:hypothetical protein
VIPALGRNVSAPRASAGKAMLSFLLATSLPAAPPGVLEIVRRAAAAEKAQWALRRQFAWRDDVERSPRLTA